MLSAKACGFNPDVYVMCTVVTRLEGLDWVVFLVFFPCSKVIQIFLRVQFDEFSINHDDVCGTVVECVISLKKRVRVFFMTLF